MNRSWQVPTCIGVVVLVVVCCLCFFVMALGAWLLLTPTSIRENLNGPFTLTSPTSTPTILRPTAISSVDKFDLNLKPLVTTETLQVLENTVVPISNLPDLAERLEGKQNVPLTVAPPARAFEEGALQEFWVTNVDTDENSQIAANLQYVTDHVYFWIEQGLHFNKRDMIRLVDTFESKIYPTDREFFGTEWSPGVDGDPHLYIVYASNLGYSLAGYFSSADENNPLAHEYSNAHEMFLLNADNIQLDEDFTYSVLAHEFQHMIHWHRDRNEETWMNEGFSELASFLNGYDPGSFDSLYMEDSDLQLNDWPSNPHMTGPHYGAGFLFLDYFLDRFGESATKALIADPLNGMVSVDDVITQIGLQDPETGEPLNADGLFLDWAVATYLRDGNVSDGRFTYHNYPSGKKATTTEVIQDCPTSDLTRDVHQYGVDYIQITCKGDYQLRFEGSTQVGVIPESSYSGDYAFWSNKGDESDMTLTRNFDFSAYDGPLSISYSTWYDLEEDYDYIYLEASRDGKQWQILSTPSGTLDDPSGNSYGMGYNGVSDGWKQETVDLSQFAGQKVHLRFEYVTDAAVNGEGMLLDDISVPQIGYFTNFEQDDGGWIANGWVRIQNLLPQTYKLALITEGKTTTVNYVHLSRDNTAEIPIHIGDDQYSLVLVVSGTTRFTRQKAAYRLSIQP